jgi:hypothetical protein
MEIWRTSFEVPAYKDQTGEWQNGHVVYERLSVTDTGERFDYNDGYSVHMNHGRIYIAGDGRRFRVWTNTVDYSGGTAVVPERKPNIIQGHWGAAPKSTAGYVLPNGEPIPPAEPDGPRCGRCGDTGAINESVSLRGVLPQLCPDCTRVTEETPCPEGCVNGMVDCCFERREFGDCHCAWKGPCPCGCPVREGQVSDSADHPKEAE